MELKRFIAENSREALQQVKQQHGDDALIISTTKVGKKTEDIGFQLMQVMKKDLSG